MRSSIDDNRPDGGTGNSRLDRELEEILSRNDNITHLPPPPKVGPKRRVTRQVSEQQPSLHPGLRAIGANPILLALFCGIGAFLFRDVSPLLANVLSLAAVVCIVHPMVQRFRQPGGGGPGEPKLWRGRVFDVSPPPSRPSTDSVRDWWPSRRR